MLMRLGNFSFDLRNCSCPDCISYVHQSQQCAVPAGCVHCVSATVYLCSSVCVSVCVSEYLSIRIRGSVCANSTCNAPHTYAHK